MTALLDPLGHNPAILEFDRRFPVSPALKKRFRLKSVSGWRPPSLGKGPRSIFDHELCKARGHAYRLHLAGHGTRLMASYVLWRDELKALLDRAAEHTTPEIEARISRQHRIMDGGWRYIERCRELLEERGFAKHAGWGQDGYWWRDGTSVYVADRRRAGGTYGEPPTVQIIILPGMTPTDAELNRMIDEALYPAHADLFLEAAP